MIHRFRLESRRTPEECRRILREALAGKEEPCGLVLGNWFRAQLSEYFSNTTQRVMYNAYGSIRDGGNGRAVISGLRFEGASDPCWFFGIFALVLVGLSLLPPSQALEKLALHLKVSLLVPVGVLGATALGAWGARLATKERLESTLDETLCELLDAEPV